MSLIPLALGVFNSTPTLNQKHLQRKPGCSHDVFWDGLTSSTALMKGASGFGARWVHPKRRFVRLVHGQKFCPVSTGNSFGNPIEFFIEAPMEQLQLPLMYRHDAPRVVHPDQIASCKTYRDAVKLCWALRRVRNMTRRGLAEYAGLYAPHVTNYLNDGKHQRDLPGDRIKAFEVACDNTAITQFLSRGAKFTVLEEMQARNAA